MQKQYFLKRISRLLVLSFCLLISACQTGNFGDTSDDKNLKTIKTVDKTKKTEKIACTISKTKNAEDDKLQEYISNGEEHTVILDDKSDVYKGRLQEFKVKILLPKGWKIKQQQYKLPVDIVEVLAYDGTGRHEVYDDKGNLVWAFSYMQYEDYPGEENNLQAIYSEVALGNHYHFVVNTRDKENGGDKLAILEDNSDKQIVYCMHFSYDYPSKDGVEKLRPGALVRFKPEHLFIAIYGDEKLGEKYIREFAKSMVRA